MVHCPAFSNHFRHAFYYLNMNEVVCEHQPEEHPFGFQIVLLVFQCLLPFFFCLFTLPLPFTFPHQPVMLGFEVGRANVFRIAQVFSEMTQQVCHVTPCGAVRYDVAVADADFHRLPILRQVEMVADIVTQHRVLPCFQQCFRLAVRKDSLEEVVRQYAVQVTVKPVALDFGDNPLPWVGAYRVYVVHPMPIVLADFHRAVLHPQVVVKD